MLGQVQSVGPILSLFCRLLNTKIVQSPDRQAASKFYMPKHKVSLLQSIDAILRLEQITVYAWDKLQYSICETNRTKRQNSKVRPNYQHGDFMIRSDTDN